MSVARDNLRNAVYKLCEQREVPVLVTDMIAEYLAYRDFFKINSLSRSMNEHANAFIYQDVVVDLDGSERSVKKASLLLRTFLTSKTAALAVRNLSLAGDPLQAWREDFSRIEDSESIEVPLQGRNPPAIRADLVDFNRAEIELRDKIVTSFPASKRWHVSAVPIWALYLYALRLMPHVQDFNVSSDYFRFPDFRRLLRETVQSASWEKLRSCSLCLDLLRGKRRHPSVVEAWDSALLALLAVRDIQSIAAVVNLKPKAVRELNLGASSITRLTLHHYQIHACDVSALLAATPNLKYLEYHVTTDWAWYNVGKAASQEHRFGIEPLYYALHHVRDSLQELHTSQAFDEDSIHFEEGHIMMYEPEFYIREGLSSLKQLHTLRMPYTTLLGGPRNHRVYEWDKVLPSSIRSITFTDDLQENSYSSRWSDETLMPVISGLVEWLAASQREDGDGAAAFGLYLADTEYEFNEPVRQELVRLCEEHGVRCSVEKVLADRHKPPRANVAGSRGGNGMGASSRPEGWWIE